MAEKEALLEEKKARLDSLKGSRSDAPCETDTRHLSEADIRREQEIEELEDEIKALETASPR